MANQGIDVGLMYGHAKYKNFSMSAADNNITALRATLGKKVFGVSYPNELTMSVDISPGVKCTVEADVKGVEVDSSNKLYHDGSSPKQGNYYYNKQSTYSFDHWEDALAGSTVMTSRTGESRYTFTMPMVNVSLSAHSNCTFAEVNKVYARELKVVNGAAGVSGTWPITSVSIKEGTTLRASGALEAANYFWESPIDIRKIEATVPATDIGNQLQYETGSNSPSKDNVKWYIRTDFYVTKIIDSDGKTENTSAKTKDIRLTRDITYSFMGSSSQTRTNTVGCSSAEVTVKSIEYGDNITKSITSWYERYYWNDTGHGDLKKYREGDNPINVSVSVEDLTAVYEKEIYLYLPNGDRDTNKHLMEYGRIRNINGYKVSESSTYRGTFTSTAKTEIASPVFDFNSAGRGAISKIETIGQSSHYTWEGSNYVNRFGVIGNGEQLTSSYGYFTRINMYTGTVTFIGLNFEWHLTRDYKLTFNANNSASSAAFNKFISAMLGKSTTMNTSRYFYSSSMRNDMNEQTWYQAQSSGAKVPWAQYLITRQDIHWGIRDRNNTSYSTTFTLKSATTTSKKFTGINNGQTYTYSGTKWTNFRQLLQDNQTLTRFPDRNFNFSFYTYSYATAMDYGQANTVGLKTSDKSVAKFKSSSAKYWLAANFYRQSMSWTYPFKNAAHPNGIFETCAKGAYKNQTFSSVAHLTMPYLGNLGERDLIMVRSTCPFMPHDYRNIDRGYSTLGKYYENPIRNCSYMWDVTPEEVISNGIKTLRIASTEYESQWKSNQAQGSYETMKMRTVNGDGNTVYGASFGVKNYTMTHPNIDHLSQLKKSVKGRGGDYVYYAFDQRTNILDKKYPRLYTNANGTSTSKAGNHEYRLPDLYTVTMPAAFGDVNHSSFMKSEFGDGYRNSTWPCNPQYFTFGEIRFSSSNVLYSTSKSSKTQTASSFVSRERWFAPTGYLVSNSNNALNYVAFNNNTFVRYDIDIDLYGELHDITFETTFPDYLYTYTYKYVSGSFENGAEKTLAKTNLIEDTIVIDEVTEHVEKTVEHPPTYAPEDADAILDETDESAFVHGEPGDDSD